MFKFLLLFLLLSLSLFNLLIQDECLLRHSQYPLLYLLYFNEFYYILMNFIIY